MVVAPLLLALSFVWGNQASQYHFFSYLVLVLTSIATAFKSRYVQYGYYLLALTWFVVLIGGLLIKSIMIIQTSSYAARMLPTVISLLLPINLVLVFVALFLGVVARLWFDSPIQGKNTKAFLNIALALAIADLSWLAYFFTGNLRPTLHWLTEFHYGWSKAFPLILLQFTFWFFLFSALPLILMSSFVKNWSKWQTIITTFYVSIVLLFTTDRMLSFLVLESKHGNVYIAQFFVSIALLLSTYYLSKYIQKRFINTKYLIGFD